ncbi:MAG: cytochrome P450 [Crocinitomix sp.]|jgi:cytochrome P450
MSIAPNLKKISDLPSPKGHFILGHLPQFNANNKHQVLERWVDECGDLFQINFVGKKFIVSADADLNDELMRLRPKEFKRFHKITEILEEMGILGVFNAEGETWTRHRKPASEALNLKKVRSFYPIIANKTQSLIHKWEKVAKRGDTLDVQKEFMKFTVDITTEIAFGYKMDTINNKTDDFQQYLEHIFPMVNERITAPLPTWRYLKRKKDKKLDTALNAIETLIYRFINEAKQRLIDQPELVENPSNFLEALLVEQEIEGGFSDKEIYSNVFSMLLAGEDTTSNSISWSLYYLAQHPEMVEKVRAEAIAVYGEEAVPANDQDLTQLKFANAIAQETMRLKPVTPNLYLQANEEVTLQNFLIPKDTVIMLQNKVAQTLESNFTNAADFIPERWMRGGCPMHENHSPEVIKAFGGGPRYCPGKNLAMHEMTMAISTLCKAFNFDLAVKKEEVEEQFSFTMYPKNLLINVSLVNG